MEPVITHDIELRANRDGRDRAYVACTRIRVQDIYFRSEVHGQSPEEIAVEFPHLSLAQIHAALAYYFDHRQEILAEIRQDEEFVKLMKARTGPGRWSKSWEARTAAMRFHLDEQVDPVIASGLRQRSVDVTTTQSAGLLSSPDQMHVAFALELRT
ncbi:MAG: DUF433 domain-containing protein [Planctomycetota bacterium]